MCVGDHIVNCREFTARITVQIVPVPNTHSAQWESPFWTLTPTPDRATLLLQSDDRGQGRMGVGAVKRVVVGAVPRGPTPW